MTQRSGSTLKRVLKVVGIAVGLVLVGGGGYAFAQASAFDSSVAKRYDVPIPAVTLVKDPATLARGKHLVEAVGSCNTRDCHGADLSGATLTMGPLARLSGPNITTAPGAALARYSDGELVRIIRHGIKKDGHTVLLMPSEELGWLSLEDVTAMVSYLRTVPPVEKADGTSNVGLLGKVLDRRGAVALDVARRIDHTARAQEVPPPAEANERYGQYLAKACTGCHGEHLSGGTMAGAPAVPRNLTPHETGLRDWSFQDFERVCTSGISKDGRKLDPFMPYEALSKMNDTEKHALYMYLRTVPPLPFGNR